MKCKGFCFNSSFSLHTYIIWLKLFSAARIYIRAALFYSQHKHAVRGVRIFNLELRIANSEVRVGNPEVKIDETDAKNNQPD